MKTPHILAALLLVVNTVASTAASAVPLLQNGGFEAGLAGWTVVDQPNSAGSWFAATGTIPPLSFFSTTVGPHGGTTYAMTDQVNPGTHALLQSFTVAPGAASVILRYSMFVNSYGGFVPNGGVLDHTGTDAQFARVDLLAAGADPFDTGAGVLQNFYFGIDADPTAAPNPYIDYTFDITSLVGGGGTFQLRFAAVETIFFLHQGVDDVSIDALQEVPEPGSLALLALGFAGLLATRRRA